MKRGFGSPNFDPERKKEICGMGNKAQRDAGKAPQWTSDSARAAGKKGLAARKRNRRAQA